MDLVDNIPRGPRGARISEEKKEGPRPEPAKDDRQKYFVARNLRKEGKIDEAIAMAESISNQFYRDDSLHEIALALIKVGYLDKARETIDKMTNYELGGYDYCAIAKKSKDPADLDKARKLAEKIPAGQTLKKGGLTNMIERVRREIEESKQEQIRI